MTEMNIIGNNDGRLLSMDEASQFLGIKKSSLYQLTMRQEIPVVKIGRLNKFRMTDLNEFINCHIVQANSSKV